MTRSLLLFALILGAPHTPAAEPQVQQTPKEGIELAETLPSMTSFFQPKTEEDVLAMVLIGAELDRGASYVRGANPSPD